MIAAPAPLVGSWRGARGARRMRCGRCPAARAASSLLAGEPGIGKSRLLAELAAQADRRGLRASGPRARRSSRPTSRTPCSRTPSGPRSPGRRRPPRHAPALRDELARQAAARPLVLCLDDVQWADPASLDALAALVRRPPAGAGAAGPRRADGPAGRRAWRRRWTRARREERVTPLALRAAERGRGGRARRRGGRARSTSWPGGNPFYLEQLARVRAIARRRRGRGDGTLPDAVAAALTSELAALTPEARALLEGAAVAGDPFDLDLAGGDRGAGRASRAAAPRRAARASASSARPTRRAGSPSATRSSATPSTRRRPRGWQLGAHARAAAALEAPRRRRRCGAPITSSTPRSPATRGASTCSSPPRSELQAPAPAAAARYFAAALRLLPERDEARPSGCACAAPARRRAGRGGRSAGRARDARRRAAGRRTPTSG